MPDSTASAELRTDAADRDQPLEEILLERRAEAVERNQILAHVGVDPQHDRRPRLPEPVEGRERHLHIVADATDVDHDAARMFLDQRTSE